MFQKLGLKDVFIGLWNRRWRILIVAVVAVLVAIINVCSTYQIFDKKASNEKKHVYFKTVSLFVDATEKSEYIDMYYQSQKVRNAYIYALDSELFAEYLQKNIVSEEPLGKLLLKGKNSGEKADIPDENIQEIFHALDFEGANETSTIKMTFRCYDNEVGDRILNAAETYANEELKGKINASSILEIGRATYEEQESGDNGISISQLISSLIKNILIYGIALEAVYFIIALVVMMLAPVINRKSDLQVYTDAPVWNLR